MKLADTIKMRAVRPTIFVDIETIIRRIRNAPEGVTVEEIVTALERDEIPKDLIFLCFKAARILDLAEEQELRRILSLRDTDPNMKE